MLGDQPAILNGAVADQGVVAVRCHVDEPVVQVEVDADGGVGGEKAVQRRSEMQRAEADRPGDPQRSGERAAAFGHLGRGLGHLAQDGARPDEERRAVRRQRELAGGALDQSGGDRAFEFGEALAHHRLRQPHAPGRGADRPGLRHRHERRRPIELHHRSAFPQAGFGSGRLIRETKDACNDN